MIGKLNRVAIGGAMLVTAALAWTCTDGTHAVPPAVVPATSSSASKLASVGAGPGSASSGKAASAESVAATTKQSESDSAQNDSPPSDIELWLPRFYRALHELELGRRAEHVRIAWYGDSHTAADFYTGHLRARMQRRFGNGGPGFVHVGVPNYRHDQVLSERYGKWERGPENPASYQLQDDGVFGLAGMRATALRFSAQSRLHLHQAEQKRLSGQRLRWELVWRLPAAGSTFTVEAGTAKPLRVNYAGKIARSDLESGVRVRASQLLGLRFEAAPDERIRIHRTAQTPQFFGAFIETGTPGVVLDTLGINGARVRTMLGWHQGTWLGELAEREPELVVLSYGTNEVGDPTTLERYREYYREIMTLIHDAAPAADCLLIGPTPRVDGEWKLLPRTAEIDALQAEMASELGCGYHSLLQQIEADGGLQAWSLANPQLAARDRVHLTATGYRQLADRLGDIMLASYQKLYGASGAAAGGPEPDSTGGVPGGPSSRSAAGAATAP